MQHAVLFLCIGNFARSIMAESILRGIGGDRFKSCSAGLYATGSVDPTALSTLVSLEMPTEGLRSKSWREFTKPGAPAFDTVITLCDYVAAQRPLDWPGRPRRVHWSIDDPSFALDTVRTQAFEDAATALRLRIESWLAGQ